MNEQTSLQNNSSTKAPVKRKQARLRRYTQDELDYFQSRKQYLSKLAETQSTILFSLDASKIRTGITNRGIQVKEERFPAKTQTDPLTFAESSIQIPEIEHKSRFPSLIHFLKAASATVNALLDQSEFSSQNDTNHPLVQMGKYSTEDSPTAVFITPSRVFALVTEPSTRTKIAVWNAGNSNRAFNLTCSGSLSSLAVHKSQYVIAGTETGSLIAWDLLKQDLQTVRDNSIYVRPCFTSDGLKDQNHRSAIVSVSIFGRGGAHVACVLDHSGSVSFWYITGEGTEFKLVKAESSKLGPAFIPTFSLAVLPGSTSVYLAGTGGQVFASCRFDTAVSPATYPAQGSVSSIAFSNAAPQIFAAAGDNGKIAIYNVQESSPLLSLMVTADVGNLQVTWSPTRASVLFVADSRGTRILVYDLLINQRLPVFSQKIGVAVPCVAVTATNNGVVLAAAEGANCVSVFRVSDALSEPLTEAEMSRFLLLLYNSSV